MSILVLFSLIVKGFGAVLEIGSQALISRLWSVETYGTYAFFVSIADGIYSLLFSGIVKFNNYYIPQGKDIGAFRRRYYLWYALPLCAVGVAVSLFTRDVMSLCAFGVGFSCLCAMDLSSRMMSFGRFRPALIGEYCLGRAFVIIAILILAFTGVKDMWVLYVIYGLQFIAALAFYKIAAGKKPFRALTIPPDNDAVPKYVVFQTSEIAHTIITQTSVIVQYLFGGAFQTALISIVLIVRKFINFISGPTSKLYQPEFSKKYASGDKKGLARVYAQITRIQMCVMMPIFTMLVMRPELVLKVFNPKLMPYAWLVRVTSFVFLSMITFGPTYSFLPMTGNEKIDSFVNWTSVMIMYLTMFLFREDQYFVVIGFCTQIIYMNFFKLIIYMRYMRCLPMPVKDYLKTGLIFAAACAAIHFLPTRLYIALIVCGAQFIADFALVFPREELRALMDKLRNRVKHE